MQRRDVLLAAAMTAFVGLEIVGSDVDHKVFAALLSALVTVPLAFRRLQPYAAAVAAVAIAAIGRFGFEQSPQTLLIAVGLTAYSAGAHAGPPRTYAALALLWAGLLVAEPEDAIVQWPLAGGAWYLGRLLRTNREQTERLRELAAELERERADHARLAITEERARISRELHDIVAHAVSVMVMQAGAERLALGSERRETREALESIEQTGRRALAEMRRLVGMLRTEGAEPELAPAPSLEHLEALVEHVERAGLPVELHREGRAVELSPGLEITAYRIVQEALTNTLKHAGPARATVHVRFAARQLQLEIADDGGGEPAGGARNGHGLPGMQERAALFGGRVEAGRADGGGYRVQAWLPIA